MKKIHFTDRYLLNPRHPVTVFVIGAGGTGSQVITNLARMSMALQALGHPGLHVTVFDPDTVSQANIGRQLFSETELGLNKAVSLVTRINRFFGYAWTAEPQCFPTRNFSDNSTANIIITCTDNIRSRLTLWKFLKKVRKENFSDHSTPIYWMDFVAHGQRLVAGVIDHAVRLMNVQNINAAQRAVVGALSAALGVEGGAVQHHPPRLFVGGAVQHRGVEPAQERVLIV